MTTPRALDRRTRVPVPELEPVPEPEHVPTGTDHLEPDPVDRDWHARGERRRRRVARALVSASVGTAIAAASHLAGGGPVPGALGVLAAWAASAWLGVFVPGRPDSLLRLVAGISGAQFLFHALFMLGVTAPGCSVPGAAHAGHHGPIVLPDACAAPAHLGHSDPRMMLWHAVAALATIVALHRVDRTADLLRSLAGLVVGRVTGLLLLLDGTRPVAAPLRPRPPAAWVRRPAPAGVFPETFRRRGPPLALAA
ncbi:putative integral membrane protein [Actinomycetales bacterium JB111]|nr:putative integral membrane protein [Actinomycetales bacterium JB111]